MARVFKSYDQEDPVKNYCLAHCSPQHPVQLKLIEETMKHSRVSIKQILLSSYEQSSAPD